MCISVYGGWEGKAAAEEVGEGWGGWRRMKEEQEEGEGGQEKGEEKLLWFIKFNEKNCLNEAKWKHEDLDYSGSHSFMLFSLGMTEINIQWILYR